MYPDIHLFEDDDQPFSLVNSFELEIDRRFYDFESLWVHRTSGRDRRLRISPGARGQSFRRWCHTLKRLIEYVIRGYELDGSVVPMLFNDVPESYAKGAMIPVDAKRQKLNLEREIQEWNYLATHLKYFSGGRDIPQLVLSLRKPGKTLPDLGLALSTHYLSPTCLLGWSIANPFKPLTDDEEKSRKGIKIPEDMKRRRTFLSYTKDGPQTVHVANIFKLVDMSIQESKLEPESKLPETFQDFIMQEEVSVEEYLEQPELKAGEEKEERVVFYYERRPGDYIAGGIPVSALANLAKLAPCWGDTGEKEPSEPFLDVSPIVFEYTNLRGFAVPVIQIEEMIAERMQRVELVSTGMEYDRTRRMRERGMDDYVGGDANNCQPDTTREIFVLREIPGHRRRVPRARRRLDFLTS